MLNTKVELFKSHMKFDNRIIASIKIEDLKNVKIIDPHCQRILDNDKTKEIMNYHDNYHKSSGKFNFFGSIIINCCIENKTNYLIDGQHRYEAAKDLFKNGYENISLIFEIVTVKTLDEVKENFKMINKNTEQPEWPEDINKDIPEEVAKRFFNKYPEIFTTNKILKKPHIKKNDFQEVLGYLLSELNNGLEKEHDIEDLEKIINDKNDAVGKWNIDVWNEVRKMKSWDQIKIIADKYGFHLGMFMKRDEEYIFDWIKDIILEKTGQQIKKRKRTRKKKIPPQIKIQVWEKWKGNIHKATCHCCRLKEITATSFHCGHIISEHDGGETTVENLRPICQSCNSSMGKINMKEYMKNFYPNNLSKLDVQDPPTSVEKKKSGFLNLFSN